jgi:hypothetical protein
MPLMQIKGKFDLGIVIATPGALATLGTIEIGTLLMRHHCGDWGDACENSKADNEKALLDIPGEEDRLFSVYASISGATIWIITEADRSATTILLPDEY